MKSNDILIPMADLNNNGIPDHVEALAKLAGILLIVLFLGWLVGKTTALWEAVRIGGYTVQAFIDVFSATYLPILRLMSVALSLALLVFIIFVSFETKKVLADILEKAGITTVENGIADRDVTDEKEQENVPVDMENKRWVHVQELIASEYPRDWKSAIMEADIMLGEMLTSFGYNGDSIGEQLKQIEKSDFLSLDQAWEAHKVRNEIAHSGESFSLTEREAKRVIRLFEEVFTEFRYI